MALEFISVLRDIRDNKYPQMKAWYESILALYNTGEWIPPDSMTTTNVAYVIESKNDFLTIPLAYKTAMYNGRTFTWSSTGTIDDIITFAGLDGYWICEINGETNVTWGELGTGDDTSVLIALNAIGKDIVIPKGVEVIVNNLTLNCSIKGGGTIKWKANSTTKMITFSGDNITVDENITFDGNGTNQSYNNIMIVTDSAPNLKLDKCKFKNGRYKAFVTDVANSPNVSFTNNNIDDWGTVASCDVVSFRSPNFIASGNHFNNIGDGHCIRTGLFNGDDTNVPVSGVIVANDFKNTDHVGVTCELYTQGVTIGLNNFDDLGAGVKVESAGGTQTDISIIGNNFKNLDGAGVGTIMNIAGERVTFIGNTVKDSVGVCDVGNYAVASGNIFENVGDVTNLCPSIRAVGGTIGASINDNKVLNSPYRGIDVGGDTIVEGNVVLGSVDRSISANALIGGAIKNNKTDGGTYGIVTNSASVNSEITGNNSKNASIANYSISDTVTNYIDGNIGMSLLSSTIIISSGAITAPVKPNSMIRIDTEGGAATDELVTISGGTIGQMITLKPVSGTKVTTIKNGTGNIRLASGDIVLSSTTMSLLLMFDGYNWSEVRYYAS